MLGLSIHPFLEVEPHRGEVIGFVADKKMIASFFTIPHKSLDDLNGERGTYMIYSLK